MRLLLSFLALFVLMTPTRNLAQTPDQDVAPPVAQVEDVLVEGRRLEDRAADFVRRAVAPARGRGLGRWQGRVCVGVINLRTEAARFIVDRVSHVASDLGLEVGRPGCEANIVIVFAEDASSVAQQLAQERRRAFRPGTSGLDRGEAAFQTFQTTDRPVRWWQLSMPVDAETGRRATRLPGDFGLGGQPTSPHIVTLASRLNTQIRDDIFKAFVIVDIDKVSGFTVQQLSDYFALVAFAQIDPDAEVSGYDSILNLFDGNGPQLQGMTEWDWSYLVALYSTMDAPQLPRGVSSQSDLIAGALARRFSEEIPEEAPE